MARPISLAIPAATGSYGTIPPWLDSRIQDWTVHKKIRPWTHQTETWNAWHDGSDVVITTPTGSGKTLAFIIPILQTVLTTPHSILAVYPLKALANDQVATMMALLDDFGLSSLVGVIDSATSREERQHILTSKRIVLTNPYILHANLAKAEWRTFLGKVSLLIVDELHSYSGIFGAEMAWVFRRLQLVMAKGAWGESGQIIAASATLADPVAHMHDLLDRYRVTHIDRSGAATPTKRWAVYAWSTDTFISMVKYVIDHNAQTLVYANSRATVERLAQQLQSLFPGVPITAYRSGYDAKERKQIEGDLRSGKLRIVVATSALATGVDIGTLDAVIMADIPTDVAVLKQVAGRAGRRGQDALIVILANNTTPLGSLLLAPGGLQQMLNRPASANADLHNPVILERQLLLLAQESPLTVGTPILRDIPIRKKFNELANPKRGALVSGPRGFHPAKHVTPHSLLAEASGSMSVQIDGKAVDHCSMERAITQFPPGSRVALRGRLYSVAWDTPPQSPTPGAPRPRTTIKLTLVEAIPEPPTTQPLSFRIVSFTSGELLDSTYAVLSGTATIVTQVTGLRVTQADGTIKTMPFAPALTSGYPTRALAIYLSSPVDHGFAHAILLEAEAVYGVTPSDIGEYQNKSRIVFYDRDTPRGAVDILAANIDHLIRAARQRINSCGCVTGCLNCCVLMNCYESSQKHLATFGPLGVAARTNFILPDSDKHVLGDDVTTTTTKTQET